MSENGWIEYLRVSDGRVTKADVSDDLVSFSIEDPHGHAVTLDIEDLRWLVITVGPAALYAMQSHGAPGEHDGRPEQGDDAAPFATSVTAGDGQGDHGDRPPPAPAAMFSDGEVVYIARCAEHGLHGSRKDCFVCCGPVEQVPMIPVAFLQQRVEPSA